MKNRDRDSGLRSLRYPCWDTRIFIL